MKAWDSDSFLNICTHVHVRILQFWPVGFSQLLSCIPACTYIRTFIFHFFFCSRFYFVGDEDLLEIIGNSKSVSKLQKHFKKMFAGVASVVLSDDGNQVLGISSREGEQVSYVHVSVAHTNSTTIAQQH